MNLDQEIVKVLVAAGVKGLKTEKIARHVYNSCNSIFTPLNYKNVHAYVAQFLAKSSKNPNSIIEKGKVYGVYHINYKSDTMQQLMLNFTEETLSDGSETSQESDGQAKKYGCQDLFGNELF